MGKSLFHDLYKRLNALDVRSYSPDQLSGLLHGYLTVYSMVRVYPWLEADFGLPGDIHERAKVIARVFLGQLDNKDVPMDTRAGYVADVMDVYQVYSDLEYLNSGVDAAYGILSSRDNGRITLPCRTPNVCRLLCNCYYFAGDEECGELAGRLVTEALGYIRGGDRVDLLSWWDAICLYDDTVGPMKLSRIEQERLDGERARLRISVEREEEARIESFRWMGQDAGIDVVLGVFYILARREFEGCNGVYGKK